MKLTGNYITGFVEADGSFQIGFEKDSSKKNFMYRPDVSFILTQSLENKDQVEAVKNFFGVGTTKVRDNRIDFWVNSQTDLRNVIIPHFYHYPLIGEKILSFFESPTSFYHGQEKVVHFKIQDTSLLRNKVISFFSNPENQLGGRKGQQFLFFRNYFNLIKGSKADGELNA